jgi:WD40 repeat protein
MIKIWDADKLHERATLQGHRDSVRCAAFSPDGKTLASGSDDGTIRLWDTYTLQELIVLEAHEHGVGQVAFTADGRTLVSGGTSASGTGEVAFWSGSLQRAELGTR